MPPTAEAVLALQRSVGNRALSGGLLQRKVDSVASPGEHQLAQRKHVADRSSLAAALRTASQPTETDERLRNSAQWILEKKALLYALTPTADSAARARTAAQGDKRAYFGYPDPNPFHTTPVAGHVLDENIADYNTEDMEDNTKVIFNPPDSAGFRTPQGLKIFVVEPSRIDAANALRRELGQPGRIPPVAETLKHETQHEADVLFNVESIDAYTPAEWALVEYRTEFRAYTAQDAEWLRDPPDPRDVERIGLYFPDPVQFQIFRQIYRGYPRVKKAWEEDDKLRDGTSFRTAVLKMRGGLERVSANPHNSPRVHAFWSLVHTVSHGPSEAPETQELIALLRRFEERDRSVVKDGSHYRGLHLKGWVRDVVDALLADPRADVTSRLAAERQKRQKKLDAQRAQERTRAPGKAVLQKAFSSWDHVRASLDQVTVEGKPALHDDAVKEELEQWSGETFDDGNALEALVGNLYPRVDWWSIVDRLT